MYRVAAFSYSQPVNLNYVKDQLLNGKPLTPTDLKPSWKGQTLYDISDNTIYRISYAGTTSKQKQKIANNIGLNLETRSAGWINGTTATSSRPLNNLSVADTSSNWWGLSIQDISNSRALQRYTGIYTSNRGAAPRRQNPIKHWRRQLMPDQGNVTGKPRLNDVMWKPGGSSYLTIDKDTACCSVSYSGQKSLLTQNLFGKFVDMSNCNCNPESGLPNQDVIRNELSNFQPVYFNNPSRITRPKSSQTILKKNYYTTTKAYLKSK